MTAPAYPEGRGLLAGKRVVVTAAAGTGIGFATAKRCAEEGAVVAISDRHERRLAESAERLADVMGSDVVAVPCDVTVEGADGVEHPLHVRLDGDVARHRDRLACPSRPQAARPTRPAAARAGR